MNSQNPKPYQPQKERADTKSRCSVLAWSLLLVITATITACSGGDVPAVGPETTNQGTQQIPASIDPSGNVLFLSTSKTSIAANDTDSAKITATVVKNNVSQNAVAVNFATSGGVLDSNEAITDSSGKASVTLKSGPKASNQIVSVSATSLAATASTPVQITGNTIALSIPQNNIAILTSQTLTATLQNAMPQGIPDTTITFTVLSGAEVVSLSAVEAITDFQGQAKIDITGKTSGTAIIQARGMGVTSQITVDVAAPTNVFEITTPTANPASMATDEFLIFTVNAPTQTQVTFVTTMGVWDGSTSVLTVPVAGGIATAPLTSNEAGTADITVRDPQNYLTQDSSVVNIYAPASQATQITVQASQQIVAPTPADATTKNSVTLTATVQTENDQAVGGAVVNFSISDPVGGGEQVSPASVQTDSSGTATTTFYSGTKSSDGAGITITATIDGKTISANVKIIIGGEAGSIVFGRSNKIIPSSDNTYYTQDITAQVTDSNGNPVQAGTVVTLNIWPTAYYLGFGSAAAKAETKSESCYFYNDWPKCSGIKAQSNEDANMNLVLDTGEDTGPYDLNIGTMQPDGLLTPHNSAAGSIPATVETDANGLASFQHTFLKQYAMWVEVRMKASVMVSGTETQATSSWTLPGEKTEVQNCDLFDSPFGYYVLTLFAYAGADQAVVANTTVQLNGMSSPAGCAETWEWSFTKVPEGSNVTENSLSNKTIPNPTFIPDLAGEYILKLTIGSAGVEAIDTVTITAS
ncbi:MAG: hypothetical protein R6W72_02795 [Desulfurivibrionaceae bacterium]